MLTLGESDEGNMEILATFLEAWNYKLKRNKKFKGKMKYNKKKNLQQITKVSNPESRSKAWQILQRGCVNRMSKNLCPNLAKEEAIIGKTSQSLSF